MTSHRYDARFFDHVDATAGRSARAFLDRLGLGFSPGSVLDVGCGRGVWLQTWKQLGVPRVLGLDGDWVDVAGLKVSREEFLATDLALPFELGRRFDLVQCLEVAEHLPETSADGLVASLVRHGDVVLFSAAPPGQGGEHHVNEQPPAYWIGKFRDRGYSCFDAVRPALRGVTAVEPWYRFNALVFANRAGEARLAGAVLAARVPEGVAPAEYAPLPWRLRRALLRRLPAGLVSRLAQLRHGRAG